MDVTMYDLPSTKDNLQSTIYKEKKGCVAINHKFEIKNTLNLAIIFAYVQNFYYLCTAKVCKKRFAGTEAFILYVNTKII